MLKNMSHYIDVEPLEEIVSKTSKVRQEVFSMKLYRAFGDAPNVLGWRRFGKPWPDRTILCRVPILEF